MVDISHDDAVAILKATSERVVLRVEKNAISRSSQPVSTDEDEVRFASLCCRVHACTNILVHVYHAKLAY